MNFWFIPKAHMMAWSKKAWHLQSTFTKGRNAKHLLSVNKVHRHGIAIKGNNVEKSPIN